MTHYLNSQHRIVVIDPTMRMAKPVHYIAVIGTRWTSSILQEGWVLPTFPLE